MGWCLALCLQTRSELPKLLTVAPAAGQLANRAARWRPWLVALATAAPLAEVR
jgi:hypothetical protein